MSCTLVRTTTAATMLAISLVSVLALPAAHQEVNLDALPVLKLVEEMRIGSASDPNLGFSRPTSLAVDRDGQVYVFESQDLEIRVFSRSGQPVRKIGRRGSGPGEFEGNVAMGVKGDTVWTLGNSGGGCRKRVTLFTRSGVLLSTAVSAGARVPMHRGGVGVIEMQSMRSDGKFTSDMRCQTGGAAPGTSPALTDTVRYPRLLFGASGLATDTVGWESRPPPVIAARPDSVVIEGRRHPIPMPPDDRPISIMLTNGRIIVERRAARTVPQATIRISRVSFSDDTLSSQSFRYNPARYSTTRLDTIAAQSAMVPGGGLPTSRFANPTRAATAIRGRMSFPAFQVPIHQELVGQDGALWLRREDNGGATLRWVLFDPQLKPRGVIDLPRNVQLRWSTNNEVWAYVRDADDVPWVVRYRIEPINVRGTPTVVINGWPLPGPPVDSVGSVRAMIRSGAAPYRK